MIAATRRTRMVRNGLFMSVIACLMVGAFAQQVQAEPSRLKGDEIRNLVTGKRIYIQVPLGGEIPLQYKANGQVSGSGKAVGLGRYMAPKDEGRWWVRGNQLCQQWSTWYDGKRLCFELETQAGNWLTWYRDDGKVGKARIER